MFKKLPALSLNDDQLDALHGLLGFLVDPEAQTFGFFGYAGTGKSTVLTYMSKTKEAKNKKIVMAAPTHKAVGVLANMAEAHESYFRHFHTIHKLLGMKQWQDIETGKEGFSQDAEKDYRELPIAKYDVMVIDECSMIGRGLYDAIIETTSELGIKVIFVGDPMQLPPVQEEHVNNGKSLAFNQENRAVMRKVERFHGDIAHLVHQVRQNIGHAQIPRVANSPEVLRVNGTTPFLEQFLEVSDTGQIIAYTNKAVDAFNTWIRRRLFGDDVPSFVPGDRVVAASSSNHWHAQDEFVVRAAKQTKIEGIPCWQLEFEGSFMKVFCCDMQQKPLYRAKVRELAETAKGIQEEINELPRGSSRRGRLQNQKREAWQEYFTFKDAFGEFRPAYATTIHCSQGSTYPQVFVAERNVVRFLSRDLLYRGKMLYVAYSRAAERLVIC